MTMKAAALIEYEQRERQRDADRMEHEQQACEQAVRDAAREWQFYPETAVYVRDKRWVELGFDGGTIRVARLYDGDDIWRWRVMLKCEECGEWVLGPVVEELADVWAALENEIDDYGTTESEPHDCARREARVLSEYIEGTEALA